MPSADRTVTWKTRTATESMKGMPNLLNTALPNLYFHITTAYAILRHNGVEVGKGDCLGGREGAGVQRRHARSSTRFPATYAKQFGRISCHHIRQWHGGSTRSCPRQYGIFHRLVPTSFL